MNVATFQPKKKNEKTGKRDTEEERKQATDFKEAACCPFTVVQGQLVKKMVCVKGVPGQLGSSERPTAISTQPKCGRVPHRHVEAAPDLWRVFKSRNCGNAVLARFELGWNRSD